MLSSASKPAPPRFTAEAADLPALAAVGARLTAGFAGLDLFQRLAALSTAVPGQIVFTTSFGLEDQAIGHVIFSRNLPIEVVTLDTGRLFPETHALWAEAERRYGQRIRALVPEHRSLQAWIAEPGVDGFRASVEARRACCR